MRATLSHAAALGGLLCLLAPSAGAEEGVFGPEERILTALFFSRGPWDDVVVTSGGELGMSGTWKMIYPAPESPDAALYGLDAPTRWPGDALPDTGRWPATYRDPEAFPLWLMAEYRAMKWSGLDYISLDVWHSLCFRPDLSPEPAFDAMLGAWRELDRRGEEPLPLALFLETPFAWHSDPPKDRDATEGSADGVAELWEPTRAFLRQFYGEPGYPARVPLRALARVEVAGEARPILHFWFPTWVDAGLTKWDAWTFRELRRLCRETFGVEPYIGVSQHVHGPEFMGGWSGPQPGGDKVEISSATGVVDYDVAWWGGMAGPQVYRDAIAMGPGHWCPRQSEKPVTLHWSPEQYAPDSTRYEYCWRKVLTDPASFDRRVLILESWNNSDEGCAICYSRPEDLRAADGTLLDRWGDRPGLYMELTRELAPYWKQGTCPERFGGG